MKKGGKRLFLLCLLAVISVSLFGCDPQAQDPTNDPTTPPGTEEPGEDPETPTTPETPEEDGEEEEQDENGGEWLGGLMP